MALEINNIFKRTDGNEINISREQESISFFSGEATQDCAVTSYSVTFAGFPEDNRILGYKTVYRIQNLSGDTDDFAYRIQNITQGTVLGSYGATITNASTVTNTKFWSTEQIAAGDQIQFAITEGVIGTSMDGDKLSYYSLPGIAFSVDDHYGSWYNYEVTGCSNIIGSATAPVNLPDGAVVVSAAVWGATEVWTLYRNSINGTGNGSVMASGNTGSEDTTISNAVINNALYKYWFAITASPDIYGARIGYKKEGTLGNVSFKCETIERRDFIDGIN